MSRGKRENIFQNRRLVNKIVFAHTQSNPVPVAILCAAAVGLFLTVPVSERKLIYSYSKFGVTPYRISTTKCF